MTTEDDARLRQLMRMSHELPEPSWNLFARTTKRFSRAKAPTVPITEAQRRYERKLKTVLKKEDAKAKKRNKK